MPSLPELPALADVAAEALVAATAPAARTPAARTDVPAHTARRRGSRNLPADSLDCALARMKAPSIGFPRRRPGPGRRPACACLPSGIVIAHNRNVTLHKP